MLHVFACFCTTSNEAENENSQIFIRATAGCQYLSTLSRFHMAPIQKEHPRCQVPVAITYSSTQSTHREKNSMLPKISWPMRRISTAWSKAGKPLKGRCIKPPSKGYLEGKSPALSARLQLCPSGGMPKIVTGILAFLHRFHRWLTVVARKVGQFLWWEWDVCLHWDKLDQGEKMAKLRFADKTQERVHDAGAPVANKKEQHRLRILPSFCWNMLKWIAWIQILINLPGSTRCFCQQDPWPIACACERRSNSARHFGYHVFDLQKQHRPTSTTHLCAYSLLTVSGCVLAFQCRLWFRCSLIVSQTGVSSSWSKWW